MKFDRPRVLAVLPGFVPSTLMDVVKPLLSLEHQGKITFRATVEGLASTADLQRSDLVVFCRNVEPRFVGKIMELNKLRVPYIYDIDDNLFEIPPGSIVGEYHRNPARLAALASYVKFAGLVRVYSLPVLEQVRRYTDRVEHVIPPLDWDLISPKENRPAGSPLRIVYPTSRIEDAASRLFLPGLKRLLSERPGQIEVFFWGWKPDELAGTAGVHYLAPELNYDAYMRRFSRMGFDIGLAPLPDDRFHQSKTNNKFREYGACRIAGIYSNVSVYSDCVKDAQTGLLVENQPVAWYDAMTRLVDDTSLRLRIQERAEQEVCARYSQDRFEAVWLAQITLLLERGTAPAHDVQLVSPESFAAPETAAAAAVATEGGVRRVLTKGWRLLRRGQLRPFINEMRRYQSTARMLLRVNLLKKL